MSVYKFQMTGVTPMLMNADDIEAQDALEEWRSNPANKDKSKKGDDRTPPWTWMHAIHHDGTRLTVPTEVLMACLREAGKQIKLSGTKTFKSATQSKLVISGLDQPLLANGKEVLLADLDKIHDLPFPEMKEAVKELGFELYIKRARVQSSKWVRVRPRFDDWSVSGSITVKDDELIPEARLQQIFDTAGSDIGIGNWRPGANTPGPWGTFETTISKA